MNQQKQNMSKQIFLLLITANFFSINEAANILAILPIASPSHFILYSPYLIELAYRGHNVTVVSPTGQKKTIPNLTDLELTGIIEEIREEVMHMDYDTMTETSVLAGTGDFFKYLTENCKKAMRSNAWKKLMDYPRETKFDLVILEAVGAECLIGSINKFGIPPILLLNGFMVPPWMFEMIGSPNTVSYIPHECSPFTDRMTFSERFLNFVYNGYVYMWYYYWYLPEMDSIAKENFGPDTPSLLQLLDKISVGMANFHPALNYYWAKTPNLIPIAGIQIKDPKPLPEDILKFLDGASEGAIYFSLGSNVQSKNMAPHKIQAILDAFAELPQKVLWKFEADNSPSLPSNVKIGKWFPQSDILAHPNIKLFISHSGYLSTVEAVYREVPVLGIPFYGDQPVNIQNLMNRGVGLRLKYKDITKDTLKFAIKTILSNSSYKTNMETLSRRLRGDPEKPLERAVYWTEYVLRHNGAPHLRSASLDLNMAQYFLLDVISFMVAITVTILTMLYFLFCRRQKRYLAKLKRN